MGMEDRFVTARCKDRLGVKEGGKEVYVALKRQHEKSLW